MRYLLCHYYHYAMTCRVYIIIIAIMIIIIMPTTTSGKQSTLSSKQVINHCFAHKTTTACLQLMVTSPSHCYNYGNKSLQF